MNATTQVQPSETSTGVEAPVWSAAQQHVAEGLRQHEQRLQTDLRSYIRSLGLATHRDGVESVLLEVLDMTSDVAIAKADRYDPACSLPAWLSKIAFHCAQEYKRKAKHLVPVAETRQVVQHAEAGQLSEGEMFDLLQKIGSPQEQLTLQDLLPMVPPSYHEVLKLHIGHGLKGVALAARLGTSEGAAATKLCRARDHLATAYQKWHSS